MIDDNVAKNKAIVLAALTGAFAKHDLSVFDRYWAKDYIQHNTFIPPFRKAYATSQHNSRLIRTMSLE